MEDMGERISVTRTFVQLAFKFDKNIVEFIINNIEWVVCLMDCSTTSATEVNKCKRRKTNGRLPPTNSAPTKYILRAVYP